MPAPKYLSLYVLVFIPLAFCAMVALLLRDLLYQGVEKRVRETTSGRSILCILTQISPFLFTTSAIKARGLAEAGGQHAMADALAANEGVAQRLELEKIRVTAQVEIGVAQAKALGEALAAMDFKLYGSPDTAQQILRMVTLTDGIGSLVQGAPPALKELGGRLIDRVLPPNGNGNGNANGHDGQPPTAPGIDLGAARPLIAEGSAILTGLLGAEERRALTLRDGIERAIALASDEQRAALLRLQGMIALVPALADQTVESVLGSAIVQA